MGRSMVMMLRVMVLLVLIVVRVVVMVLVVVAVPVMAGMGSERTDARCSIRWQQLQRLTIDLGTLLMSLHCSASMI